ncbi:hypothetical protein LCGC14_1886310 [marine sediment metagenome]|uniref:Uncharacterized protein n=1 Tax=marine sediment metagenome TaxID=412755 RepID=A0A0F9IER5_9ZZZZ
MKAGGRIQNLHVLLESTGRKVYVGFGGPCVGLSAVGDFRIFGGYDDEISKRLYGEEELTPAEIREIADHMIERWQAFKAEAT